MTQADDGHTMPATVSRFPAERAIPPATPSTMAGYIADAASCGARPVQGGRHSVLLGLLLLPANDAGRAA